MTPLQKIAMGMLIVVIPADFGGTCDAYDALPDPIGWLFMLSGVVALGRTLDVDWARWAAVLALLVSVPLWFPQVNHLLIPDCHPVGTGLDSLRWGVSVPPFLFGLTLSRVIGQEARAQEPRDRFVAGRFGVLTWGFALCTVLPAIAYNLHGDRQNSTLPSIFLLIGLVQIVFVYYLFRVHRRTWLGGPGPLEIHPTRAAPGPATPDSTEAAPDEPGRPA